jgi:hypothetical protein
MIRSPGIATFGLLLVALLLSSGAIQPPAAAQPTDALPPTGAPAANGEEPPDPLTERMNLAKASDIFVVWSEEVSSDPAVLSQNIYEVEPNADTPPPLFQLTETTSQSDAGPTDGAYGGRYLAAVTADFTGDGLDNVAYSWEGPDRKPYVAVPALITETLTWQPSETVILDPVADGAPALAENPDNDEDARRIRLAAGNFDADDQSELILAYHAETDASSNDDQVQIILYDQAADGTGWQAASLLSDQTLSANLPIFDLATGDLDGNGDDEILTVGFEPGALDDPVLVAYNADSLSLSRSITKTVNLPTNANTRSGGLALTTGNFNPDNDFLPPPDAGDPDQVAETRNYNITEEVAVTFSFLRANPDNTNDPPNAYLFLLQSDPALSDLTADLVPDQTYRNNNENNVWPTDLASGNMNGDASDELAFLLDDEVIIYEIVPGSGDQNDPTTDPNDDYPFKLTDHGSVSYSYPGDGDPLIAQDIIALEDVDANLRADLITLNLLLQPDSLDYTQELIIEVWSPDVCLPNEQCDNPNEITGFTLAATLNDESRVTQNPFKRTFALALGDFDGDGFRLGQPSYFRASGVTQPLIIVNAPPVHFDIFNDNGFAYDGPPYPFEDRKDINGCFQIPRPTNSDLSCGTKAFYAEEQTTIDGMQTQVKSDWSVSAGVSLGIKGIVDVGISGTYGEGLSRLSGTEQTIVVSERIETATSDRVYATVADYDVWEYPIFARTTGEPSGTLLVVIPRSVENQWVSTKSDNAVALDAWHEPGNIISYRPDPADTSEAENVFAASPFELNNDQLGSPFEWRLSVTEGDFNEQTRTQQIGLEANASVGFKGLGVEVSGTYDREELSTHTSSVEDTFEVKVVLGPLSPDIPETDYSVTAYAYWSELGPLVVDYAVDVVPGQPGQLDDWWDVHYGQRPDPALKLRWRYDPEKNNPDFEFNDPRRRILNWEIVTEPRNPTPGDTVTISVPVYNHSLVDSPEVPVRFYLGNPTGFGGGRVLTETTTSIIPARDREVVAVEWTIPEGIIRFPDIYVELDPENTLTEIHQNNNLGFNTLFLECTTQCTVPDVGLSTDDVTITPAPPLTPGDTATISATVSANTFVTDINIEFFNGDPASGGERIGRALIGSIEEDGSVTASVPWDTTDLSEGTYEIWVQVEEQESEPNTVDNLAVVSVAIGDPTGPGPGENPTLTSDFSTGAPGSTFVVTASNFPASASGIVAIQEPGSSTFRNLAGVTTDADGGLIFVLATADDAAPGAYTVRLTVPGDPDDVIATITLTLEADGDVRTGSGGTDDPVIPVAPVGPQSEVLYLPFVRR